MHVSIQRIQRGRNHAYTINGHKAVGVTTAIDKGFPKSALIAWAAKCAAQEAAPLLGASLAHIEAWMSEHELDSTDKIVTYLSGAHRRISSGAAARGTKVHKLAERLTRRDPDIDIPEELRGHYESVTQFLRDWKVRPLLIEHTVGSYQWGYAGTFDLIAELPDGRRVLFDYKTGKSVWPETALQLAAYRYADAYVAPDGTEIPMKDVGVTEAKAVHIRADGYDVYPLVTDGAVFKVFLHVLQVAKAEPGLWISEVERPPWMKTY